MIRVFTHGHIDEFAFLFEFGVIIQAILIGFFEKFIRLFPSTGFIKPARSDEHHVVGVAVIVFALFAIHIDEIEEIGQFVIQINHAAKDVLGMGAEVGSIAIEASHQIAGKMRNRDDA